MKPWRLIKPLFILLLPASASFGQDAQAIIDATAKIYNESKSYSVDVENRLTICTLLPTPNGNALKFEIKDGTQYLRTRIKILGTQFRYRASQGRILMENEMPKTINWTYRTVTPNGNAQTTFYQDGKLAIRDVDPKTQLRELNAYLQSMFTTLGTIGGGEPARSKTPLGVTEPTLAGIEVIKNHAAYKIEARSKSPDAKVWIWIDKQSGLVLRRIARWKEHPSDDATVAVVETHYNNQKINPPLSDADFVIKPSDSNHWGGPAAMGMGPLENLLTEAQVIYK